MQDNQDIEQYLYQAIPLAQAMAVRVREAEGERVVLEAPLEPNINHCATVFGGSAAAVATLAGWLLVYRYLQLAGLRGQVMVRRSQMDYQKAIHGAFTATTLPVADLAWQRMAAALAKGRMARLTLVVELECGGQAAGRLEGEFVVLPLS
ncbi:MAG: YiiD C-terminal domain-containing protein [Aquitalea sp.]|nr:YiiD C-terminal domain-containing protein [Aquitalea sp.]